MRTPRLSAKLLALLILLPVARGHAQHAPSTTPTTQKAPLDVGQERQGILSRGDSILGGDRLGQAWAVRGRSGRQIVIDLMSTDFDPFMTALGPGITPQSSDDDGGACNARLRFTPTEDGILWVMVQGQGEGSGTFTIRVSAEPGPLSEGSCGPGHRLDFDSTALAAISVVGPLALGDTVRGELSDNDHVITGGSEARAYAFQGQRGSTVTFDMLSTEIDGYLLVTGPGLNNPMIDDDSGGACNARLTVTFPANGTYRVIVTTTGDPSTGAYRLTANAEPGLEMTGACDIGGGVSGNNNITRAELELLPVTGTLAVGDTVRQRLAGSSDTVSDGSHAMVWTLTATRGLTVTVDLLSTAFDGYLLVVGPGLNAPLHDDDSGGACNPRLTVTFPTDGVYRLIVNTIEGGSIGDFVLTVNSHAGPLAEGECDTGRG